MCKFSKILIFFIFSLILVNFTFVQKSHAQEGQVYICPNATTSLEEINPRCLGRIDLKLGETIEGMTLTLVTYEGQEYYLVSGFINGGGAVNLLPVADAGGPYEDYVEKEILFDGSKSSDPNGDPLDFYWDFGDGNSATGQKVSHIYERSGDYVITLTVFDGMASSTATTSAKILSPPRISVFHPSFIKKEIEKEKMKEGIEEKTEEISEPVLPEQEIEKTQPSEKLPPFEIVEKPSVKEKIPTEEPKITGVQKIEPEKPPSFLASLISVFKEKPLLLFFAIVSIFALLLFLFFKIKNFIFNALRRH